MKTHGFYLPTKKKKEKEMKRIKQKWIWQFGMASKYAIKTVIITILLLFDTRTENKIEKKLSNNLR